MKPAFVKHLLSIESKSSFIGNSFIFFRWLINTNIQQYHGLMARATFIHHSLVCDIYGSGKVKYSRIRLRIFCRHNSTVFLSVVVVAINLRSHWISCSFAAFRLDFQTMTIDDHDFPFKIQF